MHSISASTAQWLDSAPDGVVLVDTSGLIRLANRNAETMFGYAPYELVGQSTEVLIPEGLGPEDLHHRSAYDRSRTTRKIGENLKLVARRKDGTEFPVDVSLSLFETSAGQLVSAAVRDISQLRDAETRLQAFEDAGRLASIVESSQDAIIGKTIAGVITSWNGGAEQMYGYVAAEMIGRDIAEIFPTDRGAELASILERVARGESVQPFHTQRVAKNGEVLEISVAISPIRDAQGAVTGASTVARDITEITRATVYQRALEAQLHAAQRLESLGQLAGGVAHDFNNLLAAIMNYSGLVAAALQDELSRLGLAHDESMVAILGDVEQITAVAQRAAALTRQLLIFGRREVVEPQVQDLNMVVRGMEGLIRGMVAQNVDHLRTVLAETLPYITIDRGQLEQVIINLAVNGRDAMPHGGELEIRTSVFDIDEDHGRPRQLKPGTYVRLTVSDTGTGMSREVVQRAFEPFFTTKPPGEGTGLGLATVYGIVTQADGDVAIYSEIGLGTTVRIHLPAALKSPRENRPESPSAQPLAKGETILLVEDDVMVRESARRILTRVGYAVLETINAEAALQIVHRKSGTIDLLLADVVMPGLSGKQLSDQILALSPSHEGAFHERLQPERDRSQRCVRRGRQSH